ncbi:MAG: hypothetical protein ACFBSC_21085 [Microcoleaceae cyanobacterium]
MRGQDDRPKSQEEQALSKRGGQDGETQLPIYPDRVERAGDSGRKPGDFGQRTTGSNRSAQNPFATVSRQLLRKFITQTEKRLNEAKECVDWYERQVNDCTQELEELRQLEQELLADEETDEELEDLQNSQE